MDTCQDDQSGARHMLKKCLCPVSFSTRLLNGVKVLPLWK